MQPAAGATTTLCSPGSCLFPENDQTYQVDASIPVSGNPGQNGTNSGNVTVFCRDCANVTFSALPGTAGQGTNPVASDRSPTLTCVSWNENPLSPIFSVRNLWSQPFIGGSAGQNGQPGLSGGTTQLFQDMTPEAVFQISNTGFWINPPQN